MTLENFNLRRWGSLALRFLAVYILLTSVIAVPIMATDTPGGEERLWFSGDEDENVDSDLADKDNLDGQGEDINPAEFARASDASYMFTKPLMTINDGTTYMEWRRSQLTSVDRDRDESIILPTTQNTRDGEFIKDAHITFLGVNGGAKPGFKTGGDSHPLFISEQGEVLNFADYRIKDGAVPDDYCEGDFSIETSQHEHERTTTVPVYNENGTQVGTEEETVTWDETHYEDGDNVCHDFRVTQNNVVRTLEIGNGAPVTESRDPSGRVMEYSSVNADGDGKVTLTLRAEITFVVEEEIEHWDWDTSNEHTRSGDWDVTERNYDYSRSDTVTVETTREVVITDKQDLNVEQTVINVGENRKHVVLEFKGPDSGDKLTKSDLYHRNLWSTIVLSDDQSVGGTWSAYSMKRYDDPAQVRTGDGSREMDFPHVLQTRLIAGSRIPTVVSTDNSLGKSTEVIGYQGMNVSTSDTSLPENVNLTSKTPLVQEEMVIANAESDVDSVVSIHGQEIDVTTVDRVPYREPNVTIEEVNGDGRLRIEVTDPVTGEPLAGRELELFGVDQDTGTTNANGVVYADRSNGYVEVVVEGDNWQTPGNVYYGSVKVSKTYMAHSELLQRARDVVFAGVFATPFAIIYFLWRQHALPD